MTTRIMESPLGTVVRVAIISMLLMLLFCGPLAAQGVPPVPEMRPFAGGYIPTGSHRGLLGRAPVFGVQGAFGLRDRVHLVAGCSWAATEGRLSRARRDGGVLRP